MLGYVGLFYYVGHYVGYVYIGFWVWKKWYNNVLQKSCVKDLKYI